MDRGESKGTPPIPRKFYFREYGEPKETKKKKKKYMDRTKKASLIYPCPQ